MRVPLEWLADYVDIELSTEELARLLTMGGLKVEGIEKFGADWDDVYVGHVTELAPHPASNKPLHVARVSLANRDITVVTGAQNVRQGDRVPVILVGGTVPYGPEGVPMRIEPRPMAGITSEGMLASGKELGISDEHSGILILPIDAPIGALLNTVLGGDVLDIETNPNRGDTLSIIGIAREVAALTNQQVTLPDVEADSGNIEWIDEESWPIEVASPELCMRYTGLRIDGLGAGHTPTWMTNRLQAAGMRPISLLVDISNYVMLEYGQPLHAFDVAGLEGKTVIVRRARDQEPLTTLDGVRRLLSPSNLVISTGEQAVGIAGVMGGENSEIGADTRGIMLEGATFDAVSVRRTAQSLNLRTEASSRFEKDLPPELTALAVLRYLQLLAQLHPTGVRAYRLSDAFPNPPHEQFVSLPLRDLKRLIGQDIAPARAADALSLLGFGVSTHGETLKARVPFWRRADVKLSADLVEEVARLVGFETVPSTLPLHTAPPLPLPAAMESESVVRETLFAAGVNEVTTHSLAAPTVMSRLIAPSFQVTGEEDESWETVLANPAGIFAHEALARPVCLANPASQDRQMLRMSLVPSLLEVLARNSKQTSEQMAFFELARTFFRRPENTELPYERRTLGIVLAGTRRAITWNDQRPGPYTFFDLKGVVSALFETLNVRDWEAREASYPALHPGRSAVVHVGGSELGFMGELHPVVAAEFDVAEAGQIQVAELDLDAVFSLGDDRSSFHPLPRHPAAYRDLAVILPQATPADEVMAHVRWAGDSILESARLFDVYSGDPLPVGSKSVAVGLTFRAPGATLTQEEVDRVMDRIVSRLALDLGATRRE